MNFPIPQRHDQVIDTYLCLNSEVRKNFGLSQLDKDTKIYKGMLYFLSNNCFWFYGYIIIFWLMFHDICNIGKIWFSLDGPFLLF